MALADQLVKCLAFIQKVVIQPSTVADSLLDYSRLLIIRKYPELVITCPF